MPIWDRFLTERDRRLFVAAGYGRRAGFGARPAVLVVDMNVRFVGDRPEPIEESVKRWRNSCGAEGWEAARHIAVLLEAAREKGLPVIYTTGQDPRTDGWDSGRWSDKNARRPEDWQGQTREIGNEIIALIAPRPGEIVIRKVKPSAFFGTALVSYLVDLQADSLLVCGATTSGCVRASVVDAFSYNYRVAIVEEGTIDRGEASHALSLFDLQQKYADVVTLAETLEFVRGLPDGIFDERMPVLRPRPELAAT